MLNAVPVAIYLFYKLFTLQALQYRKIMHTPNITLFVFQQNSPTKQKLTSLRNTKKFSKSKGCRFTFDDITNKNQFLNKVNFLLAQVWIVCISGS